MKVEYEHENNINYLVVRSDQNDYQGYQLKMLLHNNIKNVLSVSVRTINNQQCFYYNITSKQQLSKLYEVKKMQWEDVKRLCISIMSMVKAMNEYMLDLDCVPLDPEYLYADMSEKRIDFLYYPAEQQPYHQSLQRLFEYILEHFDHEAGRDQVLMVYKVYQNIVRGETDLTRLIQNCEGGSSDVQKEVEQRSHSEVQTRGKEGDSPDQEIPIKSVICEEVPVEEEKVSEVFYYLYRGIYVAAVVLLMIGGWELFFPSYARLHLNLVGALVFMGLGLILLWTGTKLKAKKELFTTIKRTTVKQPYAITKQELQECCESRQKPCDNNVENDDNDNNQDFGIGKESTDIKKQKTVVKSQKVSHIPNDGMSNTVLLSDYIRQVSQKETGIYLIPIKSDQTKDQDVAEAPDTFKKFRISNFPCIMGSMEGYCDVVLSSELVSRMHLCIRQIEDSWYIEDMNSTNGTFVNEIRIKPNQQLQIHDGDLLRLAVMSYKVEIS